MFDRHHAIDRQQLAPLRIVVNQRLGQRTVARQPLRQHLRGVVDAHLKLDHGIELHVLLLQKIVQRLGLRYRARKTVEDKTLRHVGLIQSVGNDPDHDLVRHQPAAGHDVLGLEADRRLRGHRGAQHFTGRELNDTVPLNQPLRLRSLARPRRPEKNQSHPFRPPAW